MYLDTNQFKKPYDFCQSQNVQKVIHSPDNAGRQSSQEMEVHSRFVNYSELPQ